MAEKFGQRLGGQRGLVREGVEARNLRVAEIVEEHLRLLGSNFEGAGKPAAQRAVEKRVADKKHEEDGEQRYGHGADDHFRFEARAELVFAALGPEAHDGADEDQSKDQQGGGDEAGHRIEGHNIAPVFRLEWNVERAEGEDGGEQQGEKEGAGGESPALFGAEAAHRAPPLVGK